MLSWYVAPAREKLEFKTSEIAHYLGSLLVVHNLGVGKRRRVILKMTHPTIDRCKMFHYIFIVKTDSPLPTLPSLGGAAEAASPRVVVVGGCPLADVWPAMQPKGVWVLDQGLLKGHWCPWVMACSSSMDSDGVRAKVVNFCTLNHLGQCLLFLLGGCCLTSWSVCMYGCTWVGTCA